MGLLSSIDKEFCILGKNFVKKIKINKYEKYILGEIKTLLRTTILEDLDYITGSPDINEVYENQSSANKLLLENLYKNLDEEAKNNLNIILERNSRVVNYIKQSIKFPKAKQIYTKEELQELDTIKQFEDETEVHKDYFKWKDCILPVNSFEPSVFLHKHGIDMIKNKNEILGAIIDVGANVGDSALIFRKNFPDNKIISFEPEEKNCKLCQKTIELNKINNILTENMGLGDKEQISYIERTGTFGLGSKVSDFGSEKIKVTTLDNYVKENNLEVGLIKVDIEGFEANFLRGAQETIRNQAPVLLLSIYHNGSDFYNLKPMVEEIMKNSQYKYHYNFFQPIYKHAIADCLLVCEKEK